jgi:hypothetical protein
MNNIYQTHSLKLSGIDGKNEPLISLFIPLRFVDSPQSRIFSYLLKAANMLLSKEGHLKLELDHPDWSRWIRQGAVTLAIYKGAGITTIIPLPIKMPPRVVVAKSFHVKPLIASSICVQEALLLHYSEVGASLYRITCGDEKLIDTYLPSRTKLKGAWMAELEREEIIEFIDFLKLEVKSYRQSSTKLLAISGSRDSLTASQEFWKDTQLDIVELEDSPRHLYPENAIAMTRMKISNEINGSFNKEVEMVLNEALMEQHSLSDLGQKIINCEITKLCVSLEDMHFGELNQVTGIAVEKETQSTTQDDDLLDDLIELAIKQKVQVSVVPKKYLPRGRTYLAS